MNKIFLVILTAFFIPFIALSQMISEKEVSDFIDDWHMDASNADMEAYFDKIDESGVFVGTDETEVWPKQEFYDWSKPHFDKGKAWDFSAFQRNIYIPDHQGNMAWFDEKLNSSSGHLRGSGILHKVDGKWKILHYVLSLPVPNEKFKEVIAIIKE